MDQNFSDSPYSTDITSLSDLKNYIGKELGLSKWTKITQKQISSFANISDDHQWIHIDEERCKIQSPYKKPIAHGFLVLSLASKFCYETYKFQNMSMGLNYGLDKVRFINAVKVNSLIRGRVSLISCEEINNGIKYKMNIIFELKNQTKPACIAEFIAIAYN